MRQIDFRGRKDHNAFFYYKESIMSIEHLTKNPESITEPYSNGTGRFKRINIQNPQVSQVTKVCHAGDSTLDSDIWNDEGVEFGRKTHTVTNQTAEFLEATGQPFDLFNFAVDGATTGDVLQKCRLDRAGLPDEDHTSEKVNQIAAINQWQPDVVVLSVGGNNYRQALKSTFRNVGMTKSVFLLRQTPEDENSRDYIKNQFEQVKNTLLEEYKQIIDEIIKVNSVKRLVLLSQYFPALTKYTAYFIYTGFSHLARAQGLSGRDTFQLVEKTLNDLYQNVWAYAAEQAEIHNKQLVFVDVTSSLNPLGGNHSHQIEPSEQGAEVMGALISSAVTHRFREEDTPVVKISLDANNNIKKQLTDKNAIKKFQVKRMRDFIDENKYTHLSLFFRPSSSLELRYESAFYAIMGNQFDAEYRDFYAFGLLDFSLITVAAHYLFQYALFDEQEPLALRVLAGTVSAPILLVKAVVGLALMLVLGLPIYAFHEATHSLDEIDTPSEEETDSALCCC